MGRRFLTSAAVTAAAFGFTAGPALANTNSFSLSNGAKPTAKFQRHFKAALKTRVANAAGSGVTIGNPTVINHGRQSECTAPTPGTATGYTNFFSRDTTNYSEFGTPGNGGVLIGDCSANLAVKQVGANSKDRPSGMTMVPYGGYHTYSELCEIKTNQGVPYFGDAESISYPDGQFVETCIAFLPVLPEE